MMEPLVTEFPYLKCVKEIPACPRLAVGDLLHSQTRKIENGYEYVVCTRREDGATIVFRVDHLEDCFEIVDVEDVRHHVWRGRA